MICYWDNIDTPKGPIYLAAADDGLIYCSTPSGEEEDMINWISKKLPDCKLERGDNPILIKAKRQLKEYFLGKGKELKVPMKLIGTDFQKRTWVALTAIPYGETRTYGEIAKQIGCPKGPRAVGMANNKNPIALFIP